MPSWLLGSAVLRQSPSARAVSPSNMCRGPVLAFLSFHEHLKYELVFPYIKTL